MLFIDFTPTLLKRKGIKPHWIQPALSPTKVRKKQYFTVLVIQHISQYYA